MEELDIPIFKQAYELYALLTGFRSLVPKQDRHGLWQKVEETALSIVEYLLTASQRGKEAKREPLERASVRLNVLRILLRLAKDTKAIDAKKYAQSQQIVDEIGRMLGGWIKSTRSSGSALSPEENH